jgi:hypothetical protein
MRHSIWGEPFDVLTKGHNDQGVPFTRVTSYAARAAIEGFIVLTLAEVLQCAADGTERVNSATTNVQYVEDLPSAVVPVEEPEPEPAPEPTPEPDGYDDVRTALAIARSDDHARGERLANVGHVLSRLSEADLPEDLAAVDAAELSELAESLAETAPAEAAPEDGAEGASNGTDSGP